MRGGAPRVANARGRAADGGARWALAVHRAAGWLSRPRERPRPRRADSRPATAPPRHPNADVEPMCVSIAVIRTWAQHRRSLGSMSCLDTTCGLVGRVELARPGRSVAALELAARSARTRCVARRLRPDNLAGCRFAAGGFVRSARPGGA